MGRLLYDTDSTDRHLETDTRHARLCRRLPGTKNLLSTIEKPLQELKTRQINIATRAQARMFAYNNVVFADTRLDNAVRKAFDTCRQFDRDTVGPPILEQIFPTNTYGEIARLPLAEQSDAVTGIAMRIEALGEDHKLFVLAHEIRAAVATSIQALNDYQTAIRARKTAETEEENAQLPVRNRYELNSLRAREMFGLVATPRRCFRGLAPGRLARFPRKIRSTSPSRQPTRR